MIAEKKHIFIWLTSLIVLLAGHLCASFTANAYCLNNAGGFPLSGCGQRSWLDDHGETAGVTLHRGSAAFASASANISPIDQYFTGDNKTIALIDGSLRKALAATPEQLIYDSPEPGDPEETEKVTRFCFRCHALGAKIQGNKFPRIPPQMNVSEYQTSTHAKISCQDCHPPIAKLKYSARIPENCRGQIPENCRKCHLPHDEELAHDAHLIVACEACHFPDITPMRNHESRRVLWNADRKPGTPSKVHSMLSTSDKTFCRRCHISGNLVGASSHILPAKSIICMPCHAATFSMGDPVTVITLLAFFSGLVILSLVWFSGTLSIKGVAESKTTIGQLMKASLKTIFSSTLLPVIKVLILDVFLQRRLYRQSHVRWAIHSLIFFPFVFRFFWGLLALLGSLWKPDWPIVWVMIDKNHPVTAFLFDLSWNIDILGVVLLLIRRGITRSRQATGLPSQDHIPKIFVAAIVLIGFTLEGMRMAMTGWPGGAEFAYVGYGISLLFSNPAALTDIYGYVWYIHTLVVGAFFAYLPFSRSIHTILAPLVLIMNAATESNRNRKKLVKT